MFFEHQLARLSGGSETAKIIRYGLRHWDGLTRFLDDGRIELDTNIVERSMRPQALTGLTIASMSSRPGPGPPHANHSSALLESRSRFISPALDQAKTQKVLKHRLPKNRRDVRVSRRGRVDIQGRTQALIGQ